MCAEERKEWVGNVYIYSEKFIAVNSITQRSSERAHLRAKKNIPRSAEGPVQKEMESREE